MRMARAFIASVPMGIVLVAALVVPLAVIPGTFGFDSWPSSRGARVTERQVRLPAPQVDVVEVRPRTVERPRVLVAAGPRPAAPPPRTVAVVAPRRTPVVRTPAPAPKPDRHSPSPPARPAPSQQPQQQGPSQQPQQPQQPVKNELAEGNSPVAREHAPPPAPTPQPAPAPSPPVSVPAPVERAVPSEPRHGNGHGHAYGRQDGGPHGDAHSRD
jgi:hypothetical protein